MFLRLLLPFKKFDKGIEESKTNKNNVLANVDLKLDIPVTPITNFMFLIITGNQIQYNLLFYLKKKKQILTL